VSNARVIIESTIATPDTLVYTEKGWYVSARTAKAGASYTCRAEIPDFPTISAQTTIPMPTVIDSISYTDLVGRDEEADKISSLEFRIRNDINTKRFWFVNLKIKGIGTDYDWETREWIEGLIVREKYWVKTYFNEHSGSGIGRNDTLMVELLNIDESYYRYMKQYYIYESAGYPSIGQSNQKYPMYSNVKNGLGLFTGMSVSRKEIAVKELAPNP
jgi:hypothetical protein